MSRLHKYSTSEKDLHSLQNPGCGFTAAYGSRLLYSTGPPVVSTPMNVETALYFRLAVSLHPLSDL